MGRDVAIFWNLITISLCDWNFHMCMKFDVAPGECLHWNFNTLMKFDVGGGWGGVVLGW